MQQFIPARPGRFGRVTFSVIGAILLAACGSDNDDPVGPGDDPQMALGFQIARSSPPASALIGGASLADQGARMSTVTIGTDGVTISEGEDSIVVTRVQLVLRDVRLFSNSAACQANDSTMVSGCATVRLRPTIVEVPVNGSDGARTTLTVPQGSYSGVRLQLHSPSAGDSADAAFLLSNPAFADVSVKVDGTYNGEEFEFTTDVDDAFEVTLPTAVSAGSETQHVTVAVDVGKWFTASDGSLLSPIEALLGGIIGTTVDANIRTGFTAFRDQNRDGTPD